MVVGSLAYQGLLEGVAPPTPTFTVTLPNGKGITFTRPSRPSEFASLVTTAKEGAETFREGHPDPETAALIEKLDDSELRTVFEMAALVTDPPLTQTDLILFAATEGGVYGNLYAQFLGQVDPASRWKASQAVDQGKGESSETTTGDAS